MELAKKIIELNEKLKQPKKKYRQSTVDKLEDIRLALTLDYLEVTDREFIKVWNQNMDILSSKDLHFKVTDVNPKLFKAYSREFYGVIDNNFNLKIEKKETGSVLFPIRRYRYHLQLTGIIDALGRTQLEVTNNERTFSSYTVVDSFKGSINKEGTINLKVKKTSLSTFRSNEIWKLSCSLLKISTENKNQFLANREIILNKVKTVWQTLDTNSV